jgi:acyl transferase domain-containing protein
MTQAKKYGGLVIAIIGISARFPESEDYREFWKNLTEGREMVKTHTDEELRRSGVPEDLIRDIRYVRTTGVLDGKDRFDAGFFGYTRDEAAVMDPQIRLLHEHCWHALEDAGYAAATDRHRIGLYAGVSANDNWKIHVHTRLAQDSSVEPFFLRMLIDPRFCATLVAHKLNLRGPAIYLDTACSTSLSAVHLACRALLTKDCTVALAGGICLKTVKRKGYVFEEGMTASADGHCRTFDAQASGTGSGEGAGMVVLRRLQDAIDDRDHIYAVIRATAANNDGSNKVGFTAPGVRGQAECIRTAHRLAGVDPRSISYVEAHGTATRLGDPIEILALNEAFATGGSSKFCAIGSAKSNLGHTDAAAGAAGLIKTALCLYHRQLPASLHFSEPNPQIDFDGGPFYVNTLLREWTTAAETPLRAGVSSLGMGGTNVHAVLEEAPGQAAGDAGHPYLLLTVSARTEDSVRRYLDKLKQFLAERPAIDPADLAYTLQTGRKHFNHRMALAFRSYPELMAMLDPGRAVIQNSQTGIAAVFVFSGAGFQYPGMGKDLCENEPVFREELDRGLALLQELTGMDYRDILYPGDPEDQRLYAMLHTQPVIFIFEYALARLLLSYGITPQHMIGHSLGEYAAACIAGVFTYEEALRLVIRRGQLMSLLPPGAMLSAQLTEEEAEDYLHAELSLAAVNGPGQVVFSGSQGAIETLAGELGRREISFVRLHVSQAGHSHLLDGILQDYRLTLETIRPKAPELPVISSLTGQLLTAAEAVSLQYWVDHLRRTVRFSAGITTLTEDRKSRLFIELGGYALTSLLRQRNSEYLPIQAINMIRHPKEAGDDARYFAERLAQIWASGTEPDWKQYYKQERRLRASLPGYSFEPSKFTTEVDVFEQAMGDATLPVTGLTGRGIASWLYYPSWKRDVLTIPHGRSVQKGYLLFMQEQPTLRMLHQDLSDEYQQAVEVFPGEDFERISLYRYTINPSKPEDFVRLVAGLAKDEVPVTDVVYSWAMGIDPGAIELVPDNSAVSMAYLAVIRIIRALEGAFGLRNMRIALLTRGLHRVAGNEKGSYAQALLLGWVRNIPQELGVPCCNIDIGDDEDGPRLAKRLGREIRYNSGRQDRVVALRQGQRWIMDVQQVRNVVPPAESLVRENGVYLITGGLGNVGFTLASYLAVKYKARLALTGRKEPRSAGRGDTAGGQRLERLGWLQQQGCEVVYYEADIADPIAMRDVVLAVEDRWGPINGVIHAAGVTEDRFFETLDQVSDGHVLGMFAPKVKGIENLYTLFAQKMPDFVWLTSSLSTLLGGMGYSAYAAANSYMDHFIAARATELPTWKCMVLGEIAFEKSSVDRQTEWRRTAMKGEELIEVFEWSLASSASPVLLQSTEELTARMQRSNELRTAPAPLPAQGPDLPHVNRLDRRGLSTLYEKPQNASEKKLQALFEEFFGAEGIGVDDHFLEVGGDSLKGMMLLKRINQGFQVNLALKDLLLHPTIRKMSVRIGEESLQGSGVALENEITL